MGSPNKKGFKTEVLKPFLAVSAQGLKHQFDNGRSAIERVQGLVAAATATATTVAATAGAIATTVAAAT